jgi:crotonobetainyl-CoA:carnitine CoA-transferase CaiB-like acyl-CoA transferase
MGDGLLAGRTIVEIADPLTEYGGMILAGLGADVILVEPPGGASTRQRRPLAPGASPGRASIPFLARNQGKHSLVVDPQRPADVEILRRVVAAADGVLSCETAALHIAATAGPGEAPVVTITDPDGLGRSALVLFAASGGLSSCGWPHQPPTNAPSFLALDTAGIYAAAMLLVAMRTRSRGYSPLPCEVSAVEAATAGTSPWTRPLHSYGMTVAGQGLGSARMGAGPYPIYQCLEGSVRVLTSTPRQWAAWLKLLGYPPALMTPEWDTPGFRAANYDAMVAVAREIMAERTATELFREGQALGLTITPVLDIPGVLADPHVNAREFFQALDDPDLGTVRVSRAPYRIEGEPAIAAKPAPALDDARDLAASLKAWPAAAVRPATGIDSMRPLAGLRVLHCGVGAVIPEAASFLALLGAEVIKVESRRHVDFLRQVGVGGLGDHNNAPTFNQMNLGVLSLAVDMSTEGGRSAVNRLLPLCDIVVENMRGPVMRQWGLDYESVRTLRPDVIYLSSQGLGEGPYGGYQTYGPNLQAFSGVASLWAHPDDPYPAGSTLNHPDHVAGKQALAPLLAALMRRDATGEGAFIDCAQFEAAASLMGDKFLQEQILPGSVLPIGNTSPDMAPHGCYPCAGGDRWVALAVTDDAEWQRFAEAVGEAWALDESFAESEARLARREELDLLVAGWTASRAAGDIERELRAAGIAVSGVRNGDDLAADEAAHRSGFFAPLGHPTSGPRVYTGLPIRVGGERLPARRPPLLGEHDEYVLYELLGLDQDEVGALVACGAVGY